MNYRIERKIRSDIKIVKNVVEDILLNIHEGLTENNFFNTKLILNELIINGVKHGNCEDINKYLDIDVLINKSSIIIKVSDEGNGIIYDEKKQDESEFCETGRGLMLVEGLSDMLQIDGCTVTCIKYLE